MPTGPYPDWHYGALALRKLLETVVEQRAEIQKLASRVRTLERAK